MDKTNDKIEEIPVKKNEEYEVEILDNGMEGEGIAKIKDFTIFVPGAIKGEVIKIAITKVTSSFAYARIVEIVKKSEYRIEPDCLSYKRCGGCNMRHIDYYETLNMKKKIVENIVCRNIGKDCNIKVNDVIGMGNPYNYRNKATFPFGINENGEPSIGIYQERSHNIIHVEDCRIHNEFAQQIASSIFKFALENEIPFYNENTKTGLLRNVIVKIGYKSHEEMVVLVVNGNKIPFQNDLVDMLVQTYGVESIILNVNTEDTNVILGPKNINLHGDGHIFDVLGDFVFRISAKSFYQVNSVQAEILYNKAIEMTNFSKDDVVFDLYCGIGTIGIFVSPLVKKVYGIEIVDDAIEDAKVNAASNHVENIEFFVGDVENIFAKLLVEKSIMPDVVIVDPPRKGLDEETIQNLLALEPKKITYISCNPATLTRDIKMLSAKYETDAIQPVDMFPFTSHVESITILKLK